MSPLSPVVSRRDFLVGGTVAVGAVLLGACGDDGGSGGARETTTTPADGDALSLVQFFGGLPMLAAGSDIRAPFGVADADGLVPVERSPDLLSLSLLAPDGSVLQEGIEVERHAEGLERAYYPLRFTVDDPGVYTVRTTLDGVSTEMAIKVDAVDDVTAIQVGAPMPAFDTPTPAEPRAVDPICTGVPACPLHDVSLKAALEGGQPLAFLVATPAFCQIAICGPVLDVLQSQVDAHPGITFLHAEVYARPNESLDVQTPSITELGLTFEPCLVLVGADGRVAERLDTIYDERELAAALGQLA